MLRIRRCDFSGVDVIASRFRVAVTHVHRKMQDGFGRCLGVEVSRHVV